ncbi:hypothetical protein EJ02DRAFT_417803 [Clathrospora elynae]|uniref:BZIP domain-containing protein n=1 Tax=Clathrospora elynae TaxID=706981 RepID=A0A6A5T4V9_9PLEO|nr:hypothetical protein EJ02DRAFT_417803 [Clathrospora elynae]
MVNHRDSDAVPAQTPISPVLKRKRRASCLGEQERRDRKRTIDREAQRSLREKTKTHIAELERTIQLLRDQDQNGGTASLLSEIDVLRAENERLRNVIDSVKSVVGSDLLPRSTAPKNTANCGDEGNSPAAISVGQRSPKSRSISCINEKKPSPHTPINPPNSFGPTTATRPVDLDGMTVMTDIDAPVAPNPTIGIYLDLQPVVESPEEEQAEELPWGNAPETANWAQMMEEIFGPNWRCPSPVVLHIGNPDSPPSPTSNYICPVWKKSNELFGKVFNYRSDTRSLTTDTAESELLYLGIKDGWVTLSNDWMQSSALTILKQMDELLFSHSPNVERLAVAYKSFKLLKYYLNPTKEELNKVPEWLRPSVLQSSIIHPIALNFFAWPSLRSRLLSNHSSIFQTSNLLTCYSRYLRFDWPFAFEDAFIMDQATGGHVPSPVLEKYHGDLRRWGVGERFYEEFPEIRGDIEG